jgi:selenocysteine-specific elongation factor
MAAQLDASTTGSDLQRLRIFKLKERRGQIDRLLPDGFGAICKGLFKKESDLSYFMGLKVLTTRGEAGVIDSRFGQSGKFKVHFPGGLGKDRAPGDAQVVLAFKKYVFEKDKHKIRQ